MFENDTPSVRIVVATHKTYRMPQDAMYLPLQVGASVSGKKRLPGYAADNTGENISEKNPLFCELTGLYWAWKNLNADYIGLVHYRRYFGSGGAASGADTANAGEEGPWRRILHARELHAMLPQYKIFLPAKRRYFIESLYSHYAHTHYVHHLYVTRGIILRLCPEYLETYDRVLKRTSGYMFNMMIMERQLLTRYCTWLFAILFELERSVDVRELSFYQGRYCGRVGEIIFNVWLDYQIQTGRVRPEEIKTLPCIYMEKVDWKKKGTAFLKAKFLHQKYEG